MMSALRRHPQMALKLLSAAWRTPNKFKITSPPLLSSLPSCRFSSSVIPNEEKEERGRQQQEPDLDPFGLDNVMDSEEGNVLIQGFYPGHEKSEAGGKPPLSAEDTPKVSKPAPPPPSMSEEVDVKKQTRLAEYDNWLKKRYEVDQSLRSEIGESESFREAHFGKVRMDSDNRAPERSQPRRGNEKMNMDRSSGYSLPRGTGRRMEIERERVLRGPQDEPDEGPITETIEAGYSVRMRASDFIEQFRGRQGRGNRGEEEQQEDLGPREKLVIEKIIQPRKQSSPYENPEDCQTVNDDPTSLDAHDLPPAYRLPDYNGITEQDMWNILKKCVVYQNDFLLAINKPAGVPCHSKAKDCRHFLLLFQKRFADLAKCEKIYPLHRLDKETTGVLLFAKDPKVASIIKKKFADRQVQKVYLAATKMCPRIPEGTIKIPIGEGKIPGTSDKFRQVLRPDLREYGIKPTTRTCVEAITNYKVLHSAKDAAFLEIEPVTGYKHQIRVHLGMGLGCPVIGDHKYSHTDKLAPQRLHPFVLHRIKVKQSKVREIPLHLHCNKISFTLPKEITESTEPVYIHANIPYHMKYTLKRLGLIGD